MSTGVRSILFDADGHDRVIDLAQHDLGAIGDRRLLWVDLDLDAGAGLSDVAGHLALTDGERRRIEADTATPRLAQTVGRLHLTLEALEPEDPDEATSRLHRRGVDLIATKGFVVSIHRGPIAALQRFADGLTGDTSLGVLDAADLLSSLVDEVISGYYGLAESIAEEIDRLDQAALRGGNDVDVLTEIVAIRRRVGTIRRTLAPHRGALAALARPEMQAEEDLGQPWPGLADRLEGALSTIEALRDELLGTYDIHMGRAAQRANDVMKALTLLSAVLLPSIVLAGVMGMNFEVPIFDDPNNFFIVLVAMVGFVVLLFAVARWRRWL